MPAEKNIKVRQKRAENKPSFGLNVSSENKSTIKRGKA